MHIWRGEKSPHEAIQAIIEDAHDVESAVKNALSKAQRELLEVRHRMLVHESYRTEMPVSLRKREADLLTQIAGFEERLRQLEAAYRERLHVLARDEAMQKLRDEFEAEEAAAKDERYKEFLARKGRMLS